MKTLKEYLEEQINEGLNQAVLSARRGKTGPAKVKIRPVEVRGGILYQASAQDGPKVFHKNYSREELLEYLEKSLQGEFGQLQAVGQSLDGTVLVSKKGRLTIRTKQHQVQKPVKILSHNRVKQYILKEGIPVPFLVDLGVMNVQGKVNAAKYDKFRQINRFLEYIEDILPRLSRVYKRQSQRAEGVRRNYHRP